MAWETSGVAQKWLIAGSWPVMKTQEGMAKNIRIISEKTKELETSSILTRSRTEALKEELRFARAMLEFYNKTWREYKEEYEIVRRESEEWGWQYPEWAEWPRDAGVLQTEAYKAYSTRIDGERP